MKKLCKICGIEKDIEDFRKSLCKKNNKYYYRSQCNKCEKKANNLRAKKYYLLNKNEINKKNSKRYYEIYKNDSNYLAKRKESSKKYREINKDIISQKRKERYIKNIDAEKKYKKNYCATHQEQIKKANKAYYEKNKGKMLNYQKEKLKNDDKYRIKKQIRTMLWKSFARGNCVKQETSKEILGCNIDEFYIYLLQTFKDNYGYEWDGIEPVHIDHIIPLSTAENKEDIINLCYYKNLQLLKAEDNLKKSNQLNWKLFEYKKEGEII